MAFLPLRSLPEASGDRAVDEWLQRLPPPPAGHARCPPRAGPAQRHPRARVLRGVRRRAVPARQAAALALVLLRPLGPRGPERPDRGQAPSLARAAHLPPLRRELQV